MEILRLHERALDDTARIVEAISPGEMALPTPCTEWNVRTLLNHLVRGNRRFAAMAQGSVSSPQRGPVTEDLLGDDPMGAYRASADDLRRAWREPGKLEAMYALPFGTLPGTAALTLHITELVAHGWDLARATGRQPLFDPEVVAAADAFSRRYLGVARAAGSPFAESVELGGDASEVDRLAAFLGRAV